jgi:hypothetical protein
MKYAHIRIEHSINKWEQLAEWWEPCATEPYVSCSVLLKDLYFFKGSFMEMKNLIYMILCILVHFLMQILTNPRITIL